MNVALPHAPQRPCCVAERNDKSPDRVRRRLPDLRPENIKRPDVRDRRARVGAAEDSKRPRRPRKVPRQARVKPPRLVEEVDGRELPLAQRAGERSARGLGGRKRGGNRGGVVGQEGVVCCRRDGKEELVDKRRARRRVGKRPRQVRGDPGQRVLLDTDKPPEDTPAARVKLGVGGRERRRKRPRSVERTGRCAGVPPTNRLAEGRVERAAERSNRVVPDRPGDLLRALRREVGGDGRKRVGVERSSQRPAERCDRGDGRDPGRGRLLLRLRVEGKCVGQRQGWAVKPVESRHGGDEGDERRGVDLARRLPGGDKVKGRRRGRLERRELVRVKLRGKARLWSLQERDELWRPRPTVGGRSEAAACAGGVLISRSTTSFSQSAFSPFSKNREIEVFLQNLRFLAEGN